MPASGKSHWRSNYIPDATVLSPDNILEEKWGYNWSPVRAGLAWNSCYRTLGRAIVGTLFRTEGVDEEFIWDACNPTPRDRSAILNICKGAGWKVISVYFETPREVCEERNSERPRHRKVPDIQMESMWMRLTPPQDDEPWDDQIHVTHGED